MNTAFSATSHPNSRNRVLLIYPAADTQDLNLVPLSLLYVARPLIEDGIEVDIIDQRFEKDFYGRLIDLLSKDPICVGINCITGPQIEQIVKISAFLRKVSKAPIVLGGPHPTLLPEQTLESPFVDYVVIGKGEAPFLNLVKALRDGTSLERVSRVGYKWNEKMVINNGFVEDIAIRDVPYRLVSRYGRFSTVPILSSYGCPNNCAFCVEKILHPTYHELPLTDVLSLLEGAIRLRPQLITFIDDNFLVNRRRLVNLFTLCAQRDLRFPWLCTGRVDTVMGLSDELLAFLKERGMVAIYFGIESGSQKILKLINKGITPGMVLDLNQRLRRERILAHYSFMAGFPTETGEDIQETIQLMKRLKKENPKAVIWKMNRYTPYPGTELFDLAVQNGFKPPEKFEEWSHVYFYSKEYTAPYDVHL